MTNLLWQDKYTEAMLEFNPEELPAKIAAAEKAVNQRIEQLKLSNEGTEEQWALGDALRGLRVLAQTEWGAAALPKLDGLQPQEAT